MVMEEGCYWCLGRGDSTGELAMGAVASLANGVSVSGRDTAEKRSFNLLLAVT